MAKLKDVYHWVVGIHQRSLQLSDLEELEQHTADAYLNRIRSLHDGCVTTIEEMKQRRPLRRQTWNVSVSQRDTQMAKPTNFLPSDQNQPIIIATAQQTTGNFSTTRMDAQQLHHDASITSNPDEVSSEAEVYRMPHV